MGGKDHTGQRHFLADGIKQPPQGRGRIATLEMRQQFHAGRDLAETGLQRGLWMAPMGANKNPSRDLDDVEFDKVGTVVRSQFHP